MTAPFTFSVYGTPRPQPRPRLCKGRVVSTANPKAKFWRAGVTKAVKEALANRDGPTPLFHGALQVRMVFTFVPPLTKIARIGTPHTQKPDSSNLLKLVEDVMEDCGVFSNDSKIARPVPEKWWGHRGGVTVIVESMADEKRVDPIEWTRSAPGWLSQ